MYRNEYIPLCFSIQVSHNWVPERPKTGRAVDQKRR